MTFIDNFLNRITMYRLVLYFLMVLIGAAIVFGAIGWLPYSPLSIIISTAIIYAACWLANIALGKLFRAPTNVESFQITALILALIITPVSLSWASHGLTPGFGTGLVFLLAASIFAMASKYVLAIQRKHIFNPAAIAVVLTGFILGQYASWWVGGNLPLLGFVVVVGLLVVRKIQRFDLVIAFFVAALASIVLTNPGFDPLTTIEKALIHTSLFFFAFIMLTEPLTTPPTRSLRIVYGLLVGALFSPAIHFGGIYSTPELALVVGNVFSFAASPKRKHMLTLKSKTAMSTDMYDFSFSINRAALATPAGGGNGSGIRFRPGQYMEFTLQPKAKSDLRGNRRYFTIASSPTESELHLGIKFYEPSSAFKKDMLALTPGDRVLAGSLAGDFTLPRDVRGKKFVFIAGGIGITPFRSMVKDLSDQGAEDADGATTALAKPDIVLLYSNRTASEIAYRDIFDEAAKTIGLKTIYVNTDTQSRIDAALIQREIPDYADRLFYISGTHTMVETFKKVLRDLGIPRTHIKTDFFPGFA